MQFRKSRNVRNSVWNVINVSVYPVIFLALTPWFINHMGDHLFGAWMILNAVVFISVQVLHFGIGPSLTIYIAESRGKRRPQLLNRFYNSALNFTALLAVAVAIIAFFASNLTEVEWFRWDEVSDPVELKTAAILAVLVICARLFDQVFIGFFKGFEAYDVLARFTLGQKVVTLAGQVALVHYGFGLASVIGIQLLVAALWLPAQYLFSRTMLSDYTWSKAFDPLVFYRLGIYGFWSWSQTLIAMMAFQLDRLLVAAFLGTGVVAYYSIASMIANHLHMAIEALAAWVFPAVTRIAHENKDSRPLYFTVQNLLLTLSLGGLSLLFLVREPLFTLWLGNEKYLQVHTFLELFLLFELVYILSIVPKFYLNGLARLKLITFIEMAYKSFSIVSMIALFYWFRTAESLIWGQIISLALAMPVLLVIVNREVLKGRWFADGLAFALPSLFLLPALYAGDMALQLISGGTALIAAYLVYLRHRYFNAQLILE